MTNSFNPNDNSFLKEWSKHLDKTFKATTITQADIDRNSITSYISERTAIRDNELFELRNENAKLKQSLSDLQKTHNFMVNTIQKHYPELLL